MGTEKKSKSQVFIDSELVQQIRESFANPDTSVTWVLTQLGQQLVRGMISLQAINPLKDDKDK